MNKLLILLFSLIMVISCKQKAGDAEQSATSDDSQVEMNSETNLNEPEKVVNPTVLPDPCSLLSKEELASIFNIAVKKIELKPGGTSPGQDYSTSCFISWEKDGGSQGVLLQVMKNPLYGEYDEWASSYIEVLASNGEISYPDNVPHIYEKVEGLGDAAVLNKDLGKMYWRKGDEMVFGIIFRNGTHSGSVKKTGITIGNAIMGNLK